MSPAANTPDTLSEIFDKYRRAAICGDYTIDTQPISWFYLCALAGTTPENESLPEHKEQWKRLYDRVPKKYRDAVIFIENTMADRYKIDADCNDDELMLKTAQNFQKILKKVPNNGGENTIVRQEILNHLYSIYEQYSPGNQQIRFAILKQMVREIKHNDGSFDHNPLNITARRMEYFMRNMPIKERYALLLEIEKKTIDRTRYNYTYLKKLLSQEYEIEKNEQKQQERETNQQRYQQIRQTDLPSAQDNQTKIKLYKELLALIKDQEWGRTRKFNEKKTIYNHLIPLYQAEGMYEEAQKAKIERQRFIDASNASREAARIKGYKYKTKNER